MKQDEERREKTRIQFKTQVVLITKDKEVVAKADSRDLSRNGMFVSTEETIPVGTPCDIELYLTGSTSRLSIKMTGSISREDKGGLGIQFESIEADSFFHLRNLLTYNASDPNAMEKELKI